MDNSAPVYGGSIACMCILEEEDLPRKFEEIDRVNLHKTQKALALKLSIHGCLNLVFTLSDTGKQSNYITKQKTYTTFKDFLGAQRAWKH